METRQRRTPPPNLGSVLRAARRRNGFGLRQTARRLGISPGYLANLEAGRRCPSRSVAEQLADGLNMSERDRATLFAAAVEDVGRDHPLRVRS